MTRATRCATAAVLALALTVARPAHAYRPFDGTDAAVAGPGELELELGPFGVTHPLHQPAIYTPSLVVNLGLLHGWELVLEGHPVAPLSGFRPVGPWRVTETGAFLKRVVREGALQGAPGPSVAVEVGPLLPEIADDGRLGMSGALIASQRWAGVTAHLNASGARTRDGVLRTFAGLIVEAPDTWRARPVLEIATDGEGSGARTWSLLEGVVVRLGDDVSADAALRYARVDDRVALEARAGLTCTLHLWAGD